MGDGFLTQIATDWRELQLLKLGRETVGWGGESRLTLTGLMALAILPKIQEVFYCGRYHEIHRWP